MVGGRGVGQAEDAAGGVEQGVGIGGVTGGDGRAEGAAGVVEELVGQVGHGLGDGSALGVGQVGSGEEEAVELAADRGLGAVGELAEQGPGIRRYRSAAKHAAASRSTSERAFSSRSRRSERFRSTWARRSSRS